MEQKKPWVEAFRISADEFKSWDTLKGVEASVTYWALENGHLTTENYFNWARNFYGLAVASDGYFQEPKDRQFWESIRSVANWSHQMLPLEQWDGVIFVGCVEPPLEVKWSFPVCYILCTPQNLRRRWQDYQVAELSFTSVPPIPIEKVIEEGPVGLTASQINLSAVNLALVPPIPPAAPSTSVAPTPAPVAVAVPAAAAMPAPPAAASRPPPPPVDKADVVPETHEVFFQDDIPTGVFLDPTKTPPPVPAATVASAAATTQAPSLVPADMIIDPDKALANIDDAKDMNQALTWFCKNAVVQYEHVFFFLYEGNVLKPHRISKNLTATRAEALNAVDPSKASVFRIVKRTNLPYHGPVVDSDINKAFFNGWGFETYPAIVTCLPLMFGSEARGQILAVGGEKCAPQEILQLLERLTMKLYPTLAKIAA